MRLSDIAQYIEKNDLLQLKDKVVVGVSGGADSIALLDILIRLGYDCIAAHCNFHLRDEESNRDETFVTNFCAENNILLEKIHFNTEEYAQSHSISIEMAARELRYSWFEDIRIRHEAKAIAIAHHMDDSVETVLLNLVRGTGIKGLTGIQPKLGYIVRPLLNITRADVVAYLERRKILFVDDSTNMEDIYTRNKIRLNIIPMMETINPSVKNSINQTACRLQQVQNIYSYYIESVKPKILRDNKIEIAKLLQEIEPKAILFEILSEYGFNGDTSNLVYNSLNAEAGKVFYSNTHRILKDREYLILSPLTDKDEKIYTIDLSVELITEPIDLKIEQILDFPIQIEKSNKILYLDKENLKHPLILRKWKEGDWFIPFGMNGKKKVSDYFTNLKFSLYDKENTWLLCSGEDIVWIVGYRSDNRYRISTESKQVMKITFA